MSHITIRAASPANKERKQKQKLPSKKLWIKASHSVQDLSHWKNSESTTRAYTAKASYRILLPNDKIQSRGECININQNDTVVKKCCGENISEILLNFNHKNYRYLNCILNSAACISGLLVLFGVIPTDWSYPIGILWMLLPIQIMLVANTSVMWRIWRKSMLPYIQLYVSVTETWAFCDLCDWDTRIYIAAPSMLFNQIMIINSDAVYFRPQNKKIILAQVVVSILWKVICVAALRFGLYPNMTPRIMFTIMTNPNFFLHNASV